MGTLTEPKTVVSVSTRNFHNGYDRLVFEHENKSVRNTIRTYGDTSFGEYIPQNRFIGYYSCDDRLLILQTSKRNANEATRRLMRCFPALFKVSRGEVNFANVIQHVDNVWGGWIGGLNYGNLRSAGLFGDHVNLNPDFDRMRAAGTLSCLNVQLSFEHRSLDFMITKQRGLVFLSNLTDEEDLEILTRLRPILYE